jgi:ATP-dependent DNA helicase RecG
VWQLERSLDKWFGSKTRAKPYAALGLGCVEDLLYHFPRRYEQPGKPTYFLSDLKEGEHVTVLAQVVSASARVSQDGMKHIVKAQVTDGLGTTLDLTFFYHRPQAAAWALRRLRPGAQGLFMGTVTSYRDRLQLTHPATSMLEDSLSAADRAVIDAQIPIPIYPASSSLSSWKLQEVIGAVLDTVPLADIPDPIPAEVRAQENLPPLAEALRHIHQPATADEWGPAQHRFRFAEAFTAQVALGRRRVEAAAMPGVPRLLPPPAEAFGTLLHAFDERLPFHLTAAQRRAGNALAAHLSESAPMQVLLQGDVGSGKTVVALRAMLQVVDAGGQAALLAPTEVLATQHLQTLRSLLGPLAADGEPAPSPSPDGPAPAQVRLLTGSLGAAERRATLADLASGRAGIVIGTHALLSEPVDFADLGLAVIDEQHRFGVEQRDVLRTRGSRPPHVLVMTATPIPRSIAMTVFGDLETVTLDEIPGGRPPVSTHVVPTDKPAWMARVWQRTVEEAGAGHAVFVVCPRIDAHDDGDTAAVAGAASAAPGARSVASVEETQAMFAREPSLAGLRVAAMHGRLTSVDKEGTMRAFADGDIDILVATTVVEVGIDVPRATLMVVLDADRFGLAQLHQLRGRIGRGSEPGTCLLVTGAAPQTPASERLAALAQHRDGFALAELDLDLRREGDVLGAEQSGPTRSLHLLRVARDRDLIAHTRMVAWNLVVGDPHLRAHPDLADFLARRLGDREEYLERA